eukprot:tig00020614_g12213.t2
MKRAAARSSAPERSKKIAKSARTSAPAPKSAAKPRAVPSSATKSSLLSEINKFLDPKPQEAEEDDVFMDGARIVGPFDEADSEPHEDDRPFSARLRRSNLDEDPKYAGQRVSRAQLQSARPLVGPTRTMMKLGKASDQMKTMGKRCLVSMMMTVMKMTAMMKPRRVLDQKKHQHPNRIRM